MTNETVNPQIDWQQVALNGGPPCFFVEGPQYCGRAECWPGHGNEAFHDYVSLDDLLATVRKEETEAAIDAVRACSTRDELHPDISITSHWLT